MKKISVIFMGTGAFGGDILENLCHDSRFQISGVITGQNKKAGRNLEYQAPPIKTIAIKNNLIVHQPKTTGEMEQKIILDPPDLLLVVSFAKLIPMSILSAAKIASVNVHPSMLPKFRGASPIQETILQKEKVTGISWIKMNEKMDAGEIIDQEKIPVEEKDTCRSLTQKLASLAAAETGNVLARFKENLSVRKQDEASATYCRKITKEDGKLDFMSESAAFMVQKIKAYEVWPGCYIFWNGMRLKILSAMHVEQKNRSGAVAQFDKHLISIGTIRGSLVPLMVQPESKKPMRMEDFLRGQKDIPKEL